MKRVNIFIEIQSQTEGLDFLLTKGPERLGRKVDLPATAVLMAVHSSKRIEGRHMFMLNFAINLAPGLVANWLCEKINGRATKLSMDRKEVPIDKSEIERVIAEKMKKNPNCSALGADPSTPGHCCHPTSISQLSIPR